VLAACSADEQLAPVGSTSTVMDAGHDAAMPPPPPPPVDAGTVKRTVMMRNPFGGPAGNHLADGDFEFSTAQNTGGQLGWRAFTTDGAQELAFATETGGLCRSGLRCAVMGPSMLFLLRGTSAKNDKGNIASGWAKGPEGAGCGSVRALMVNCDTFTVGKQLVGKKADDGWCHYTAAIGAQDDATCLYIDSTLKKDTTALVDAFVLGPDDGTVYPEAAEFWAPDAELVARLEAVRARVVATMPFAKPQPRPRPTP
jgi:hypothetical protein